jgi:hypothetical protein
MSTLGFPWVGLRLGVGIPRGFEVHRSDCDAIGAGSASIYVDKFWLDWGGG